MYEQLFHLSSRPFTSGPFARHYVANKSMHDALSHAHSSIDRGAGPVLIIGENGSGKSLLLTMIQEEYSSQFNVINVACSRDDQRQDLLQSILYALELPYRDMSEGELRLALIDFLKPGPDCPNGILLLVDDGHDLSPPLLEEIRLITNFVREGQPRVRLVIAGTSRLEENLTDPKLESLNQRISARCYLQFMTREETRDYVNTHLKRVGGTPSALFTDDAIVAVHDTSGGCPRFVNQICEQALILAATDNRVPVSADYVREAWRDVQGLPTNSHQPAPTQQVQSDEQWTVIEFGSLDDDQATPETGGGAYQVQELEFVQQPLEQTPSAVVPDSHQHEQALSGTSQPQLQDAGQNGPIEYPASEQGGSNHDGITGNHDGITGNHDGITGNEVWQGAAFEQSGTWEDVPVSVAGQAEPEYGAGSHLEHTHHDVAPIEQVSGENQAPSDHHENISYEPGGAVPGSYAISPGAQSEQEYQHEVYESTAQFQPELEKSFGMEETAAPAHDPVVQESVDLEPQSYEDPFAEDYESEETLADQYSPVIAEHNLGSLDVTREHLDSLKQAAVEPVDGNGFSEPENGSTTLEIESTYEAQQYADDNPAYRSDEAGVPGPIASETQVSRETDTAPEPAVSSLEENLAGSTAPEPVADTASDTANRDSPQDDEYIQRRTMEILQSLQDSNTTHGGDPDVSGYDPMKSVSEQNSEPEPAVVPPASDFVATLEVSSINAEGDRELLKQMAAEKEAVESETQKILNEIARQRDELREVVGTESAADALAYAEQANSAGVEEVSTQETDTPQSISFESAVNSQEQLVDEPGEDDKDMIIVSQTYQMQSPSQSDTGQSSEPRTTSTGRAERMDYQSLFNQLRNISADE